MNFQRKPIPAAVPLRSTVPASTAPANGVGTTPIGAHARKSGDNAPTGGAGAPNASTLSLAKLLEDAGRFERDPSNEGELSYLANIAENLLRARPGIYAEECLKDFLSSLESALENEAEDRRFNGAERIEL